MTFALSEHELATRMSYLLWGTTPDDALLLVGGRAGGLPPGKHVATSGAHPAQCLVSCRQAASFEGDALGEVQGNLAELFA